MILNFRVSCFYLQSARMTGAHHPPFNLVLGAGSKAICMFAKHAASWATSHVGGFLLVLTSFLPFLGRMCWDSTSGPCTGCARVYCSAASLAHENPIFCHHHHSLCRRHHHHHHHHPYPRHHQPCIPSLPYARPAKHLPT